MPQKRYHQAILDQAFADHDKGSSSGSAVKGYVHLFKPCLKDFLFIKKLKQNKGL